MKNTRLVLIIILLHLQATGGPRAQTRFMYLRGLLGELGGLGGRVCMSEVSTSVLPASITTFTTAWTPPCLVLTAR